MSFYEDSLQGLPASRAGMKIPQKYVHNKPSSVQVLQQSSVIPLGGLISSESTHGTLWKSTADLVFS